MSEQTAIAALALSCVFLFVYSVMVTVQAQNAEAEATSMRELANRVVATCKGHSPYARLLGRTVMAKVYEGSDWERMVVVAVSWRGAVAVRPERDLKTKARWIHKDLAPQRVREIGR